MSQTQNVQWCLIAEPYSVAFIMPVTCLRFCFVFGLKKKKKRLGNFTVEVIPFNEIHTYVWTMDL